jgi:transcriptional regulator with XRE-family HTH domain
VTETMRDEHQARIGAQIAHLRERQGWSQRALARWVGIDQSAVSRIEAGRRRLSADELQRFAEALHVSADELLKGGSEPRRPAPRVSAPSPDIFRLDAQVAFANSDRELAGAPGAGPDLPFPAQSMSRDLMAGSDADDSAPAPPREGVRARASSWPSPPPRDDLDARTSEEAWSAYRPALRTASDRGVSRPGGLPDEAAAVARDWFALRALAEAPEPAQRWSTGHSAEGKPERVAHAAASLHPGAPAGDVLYDRIARFWRSELHVDPDDGPLPDLVPLLEDGYGAQVIVARVGASAGTLLGAPSAPDRPAADHPVAAAFTELGVPFIFINAARPVVLQRFALAHAFAHHVLGHGDVVDRRIEWSRNVPPEAAANDFAEELLAPVRAVQRWYERRAAPRWLGLEDLLGLGNAFGISAWAALYRSRAAGRLQGKQFHILRTELQRHEWELLPRQAYLGGLRDTLAHLTPDEVLPQGEYGGPAVLREPAAMRAWALAALGAGRLSLEDAAALLRLEVGALAEQLARLGLE